MADVSERREITVRGEDRTFVFIADSAQRKLVIQERAEDGGIEREVCAITIESRDELAAFFEGLRRVIGPARTRRMADDPAVIAPDGRIDVTERSGSAAERRRWGRSAAEARGLAPVAPSTVRRARARNPNAFLPWSADEERDVSRRFEAGESPSEIAQAIGRSRGAIETRLRRLGLLD